MVAATSPPVHLRELLAGHRRAGEMFAEVWPEAVRDAAAVAPAPERQAWRSALNATRSGWREAYGVAHQ